MMDHTMIGSGLDDFVDAQLDDETRMAIEQHLAGCEPCRREVESIRGLQFAARSLPRDLVPPRDLWVGIAARIEQEALAEQESEGRVKVLRIDSGRRSRFAWWPAQGMLAAAAAVLLVVLSSSITVWLMREGPAASGGPIAAGPTATSATAPPMSALVAFEPAEKVVVETVEQLEFVLEAQRDRLDPETIAVVEENLRIIDRAIAEAQAALEADPNNRDLTFLLMDVYRTKVDLLQSAVQISSL